MEKFDILFEFVTMGTMTLESDDPIREVKNRIFSIIQDSLKESGCVVSLIVEEFPHDKDQNEANLAYLRKIKESGLIHTSSKEESYD